MMCAKVHFTHTECENRYENEVKMHKAFKKVSQMKASFKQLDSNADGNAFDIKY